MKPIRRIVTGHNDSGGSCFASDELMSRPYHPGNHPRHAIHDLWKTAHRDGASRNYDPVDESPFRLAPPVGGTVIRIIDLPPDRERDFSRLAGVFAEYGAVNALDHKAATRQAAWHRTDTIDYAMVLEGEVWALVDEGETLMRPGDVLIQRATNHAWSNRSDTPCRLLFVLIDDSRAINPGT